MRENYWRAAIDRRAGETASWASTQKMRTSCLFCNWSWVGEAGEAMKRAVAHREKKHPTAVPRPRSGKSRSRGR